MAARDLHNVRQVALAYRSHPCAFGICRLKGHECFAANFDATYGAVLTLTLQTARNFEYNVPFSRS